MEGKKSFELTSFHLHIIAMAAMLLDHMWITVVPGNGWMTDIGRIAFPIFAFMTVEGFFNTKNLKKYIKRLFVFALISEIPFNLVAGSSVFYPLHQNVLWTFLIGIMLMQINEKAKEKNTAIRLAVGAGTIAIGFVLGLVTFTDYNHAGVLTVLVFYFFCGRSFWHFAAQLVCLWYINTEILSGFYYPVYIFGMNFEVLRQSFAIFALLPIWLYKGKQGFYNKTVKAVYYWFYPVHLFVLWCAKEIIC